jgi:hypothetical protein
MPNSELTEERIAFTFRTIWLPEAISTEEYETVRDQPLSLLQQLYRPVYELGPRGQIVEQQNEDLNKIFSGEPNKNYPEYFIKLLGDYERKHYDLLDEDSLTSEKLERLTEAQHLRYGGWGKRATNLQETYRESQAYRDLAPLRKEHISSGIDAILTMSVLNGILMRQSAARSLHEYNLVCQVLGIRS